jgi:hypothetical protein
MRRHCAFSLKAHMPPRATTTEGLARWLIAELAAIEGDRPVQWVMLLEVMPGLGATWEEAEQAADFAAVGKPFRSEGGEMLLQLQRDSSENIKAVKGFLDELSVCIWTKETSRIYSPLDYAAPLLSPLRQEVSPRSFAFGVLRIGPHRRAEAHLRRSSAATARLANVQA